MQHEKPESDQPKTQLSRGEEGASDPVAGLSRVTRDAAEFVAGLTYADIPAGAIAIGKRCILDTVGLYAAGLTEDSTRIVSDIAREEGRRGDAWLLGGGGVRVPMRAAARTLGISTHAHDFDDTQVSKDPRHVYGLLTHPTTAPLSAALVTADALGSVMGPEFLTAFLAGYDVSCKISEWLLPEHYIRGHHSSGTVATFKAMCEPCHVGRAVENGVVAADMARRGFRGDPQALDGKWGFAQVLAGGFSPEKLGQGFGRVWSIEDPGVSIKPYPSGILTHQAMDMVLKLVTEADIVPARVAQIRFYAGDNILNPIRYPVAQDALQAKFSMAALISMIVLYRRPGLSEFRDGVIQSPEFQAMQHRVSCSRDAEINAQGFKLIRSRIEVEMADGTVHRASGDLRYRGGPDLPFTEPRFPEKCGNAAKVSQLCPELQERLIAAVQSIEVNGPPDLLKALSDIPETSVVLARQGDSPKPI